jgi:DNA-binding NtrC family response regulator
MARRILQVEDDVEQATLYAGVLTMAGYDVVTTVNAEEALVRLAENTFDLALIDWDLPDMAGDALVLRIRAEYPAMKTLLFSCHNDVDQAAKSSGADAWMRKTDGIVRLRQVIADLLQSD